MKSVHSARGWFPISSREGVINSGEGHIISDTMAAPSRQAQSITTEDEYAKEDRGRVTIVTEKYITAKSIKYIERDKKGSLPYMSPNIDSNIVKTIMSSTILSRIFIKL